MNKTIVNHIDTAFDALQDISLHILGLEQHLEQLETENQNLAEQILDAEQDAKYFENAYWALAREKARGETE